MQSLALLDYQQQKVRSLLIDDEPWFLVSDICAILDIKKPRDAAQNLEDYEVGHYEIEGAKGKRKNLFTKESGVYSLVFTSRKPEAKAFRRWVHEEVIPSIRKYGFYDPKRLNHKEVEKLENEPHEGREKTPNERFWDEIKLYEARYSIDHRVGLEYIISKNTLTAIKYGTSIINVMKKREIWLSLASLGFDIKYIIWGFKELTEAEKKIIAAFRLENKDNRQKTIANATLLLANENID